jgi:glycosyltransferase involved in cell wall biosynthesis
MIMKHAYTNNLYHKRIMILGPLPPPLGGVSVHVQRVIAKLKEQHNDVIHLETCLEYRYRFFVIYMVRLIFFVLWYCPDQVHLHTLYLSNGLCELEWIMRLKKLLHYDVLLIEHDCRYMYKRSNRWKRKLNSLLPQIKQQIFIGNVTAQSYAHNSMTVAQCNTIESAFLPPDQQQEQLILASYPSALFQFIEKRKPLLLANAFQLSLLDGKDLYGFDSCIELMRKLKVTHGDVGFIFVLGSIGNELYYQQLLQRAAEYDLTDNCYFLIGQRQLWPLLKKIDLFLRPTLSDGASVSIEEALWAGKPVVATNVCLRPTQVAVYDVGDSDLFYELVGEMLDIGFKQFC